MLKKGILWDFIGKLFNQGITFFVSIFLARLLLPEDFALIAMVMAFFGIARVFIDLGLSEALIQQQDIDDIHYSSIFWLNLFLAIVIATIFYFGAPQVSQFFHQDQLNNLAKVLSSTFVLGALGAVHTAILRKKMDFKYLSQINIISAIVSGILGIYAAYNGYGVWSLVIQYVSAAIIRLFLLWKGVKWIPSFRFSWIAVKPLWNFSKKLFLSAVLNNISVQLDVFVIGKLFAPATLGFYSRGKTLNYLISSYSSGSLTAVLFPALSRMQHDIDQVKEKVVKFFQLAAFVSFYLGGVLYITAEDVIVLMFTDKWMMTVPYFRIMVLTTFAYPLSAIVLTPLTSLGRSDIFLKLEIIKKIMLIPIYLIGFQFGISGFLYATLVLHLAAITLNGYYSGKLINWSVKKQWIEILIYAIPAYIGSGTAFILLPNSLIPNHYIHFLLTGSIFTLYYIFINLIFKTKASQLIINLALPLIKKTISLRK
mgnify:CR=1 FL=1